MRDIGALYLAMLAKDAVDEGYTSLLYAFQNLWELTLPELSFRRTIDLVYKRSSLSSTILFAISLCLPWLVILFTVTNQGAS